MMSINYLIYTQNILRRRLDQWNRRQELKHLQYVDIAKKVFYILMIDTDNNILYIQLYHYHRQTNNKALKAKVRGHFTNKAVLNFDDDKRTF